MNPTVVLLNEPPDDLLNEPPNRPAIQPPGSAPVARFLTILATGVSLLALGNSGEVAADQPPRVKACTAAVVDKHLLTINCPKGGLSELLTELGRQTGLESDVSAGIEATPVSVVLERATLQLVLDTLLAGYNYSLDGTPALVGGRANGTKVVVLGLREKAEQDKRFSADTPTAATEPAPSRNQEAPSPAPETAGNESAHTEPAQPPASEVPGGFAIGPPAVDPEAAARARDAFYANLPAPGATLPPAAAHVELPPSPQIQNSSGPGDGRQGLPLPEFTPGPPTRTPPAGE